MKLVELSLLVVFSTALISGCGTEEPAVQPDKAASVQSQARSTAGKAVTVKGIVRGEEFRIEQAILNDNTLTLRQGKDFFADRSIDIVIFGRESLENKTIVVESQTGFGSPHLRLGIKKKSEDLPDEIMIMDGYEMKLAFGKATDMGIPFSIRLATKEIPRTDIEGAYFATYDDVRLKDGRVDLTYDSFDTLRHIASRYLHGKYKNIELLEDFNASYKSHGEAEHPKSGFIGYEIVANGSPLTVRLQLFKGENGWHVANQLKESQINQAHPLGPLAATDERSIQSAHARTAAASTLENYLNDQALMPKVRSTSVGCYTTSALDKASCRAVYGLKMTGEVTCMSKNYLLVRSEQNWNIEREIRDTEKVDHASGELVTYKPFRMNCS